MKKSGISVAVFLSLLLLTAVIPAAGQSAAGQNEQSIIKEYRGITAADLLLADGRIRRRESRQWTNGDRSQGRSVLDELSPATGQ